MRGLDARRVIDVPHDVEVVVLTEPADALLVQALERLANRVVSKLSPATLTA